MEHNVIESTDSREEKSQVDFVNESPVEANSNPTHPGNDIRNELAYLSLRIKTIAALLTFLKAKATIACMSGGTLQQNDADRSEEANSSGLPTSDIEVPLDTTVAPGHLAASASAACGSLDDIVNSVRLVANVMELLRMRVVIAEAEVVGEQEKVRLGLEEIRRKTLQMETMSVRVKEMEQFALGTNTMLNEMRQKVEDMVEETNRQRQRSVQNEQELARVKHDFEALQAYVGSLVGTRESLLTSQQQELQTREKLFDRLDEKIRLLEHENAHKDTQIQNLVNEKVELRAMLDQKEAQLLAMTEQCKFMALRH